MIARMSGLAALLLLLGLSSAAQAQGLGANRGFVGQPRAGVGSNPYSFNGGFGDTGVPGFSPNFNSYGYGRGPSFNGYSNVRPSPNGGRMANNMNGLIGTIQQQTGRSSYRNPALSRNRRGR